MKKKKKMLLSGVIVALLMILTPIRHTDKEIKPYLQDYLAFVDHYCYQHEMNLPPTRVIRFDKLDTQNEIAYCSLSPIRFEIVFDREYWNFLSDEDKYQLAFHEFTHCYFGQEHIDYRFHFMFPSMTKIKKEKVDQQLANILTEKCTKWKQ